MVITISILSIIFGAFSIALFLTKDMVTTLYVQKQPKQKSYMEKAVEEYERLKDDREKEWQLNKNIQILDRMIEEDRLKEKQLQTAINTVKQRSL